jgi:F-type H+-transporting ATPase subunit delta
MSAPEQVHHQTVFDDELRHVGGVYAEALLNAAEKSGQADEVYEELRALVVDVFRRDPQLEEFLSSRAVSRAHKDEVLQKAFDGRATDVFSNFLHVLNAHDRLDTLRAVALAYRGLYEQRADRVRVQVRSAMPLQDDQQDRLRNELRETFKKEPVLETRVDPDLLGGLIIQVGDHLYDSSIRTRLDQIRNQLIERSNHEIQSGRDRFSS